MTRKEELGKSIADDIHKWKAYNETGGSDPFCADGVFMNGLRRQILASKKQCESEFKKKDYPPEYYMETPPEVKDTFVARASQIKKNAQKTLKTYEQNSDYLWLKEQIGHLNETQIRKTGIQNVVDFPEALSFFISTGRLVDMRRHENPERYLESFRKCREKVERLPRRMTKPAGRRKTKRAENMDSVAEVNDESPMITDSEKKKADKTETGKKKASQKKPSAAKAMVREKTETTKKSRKENIPTGQLSMFDMGVL